jgi:hypothetical protein
MGRVGLATRRDSGLRFLHDCAALALTAIMLAVPYAYEAVQWASAAYLLHLAWGAVKPAARSVLEARHDLAIDGLQKLFAMGFFTNLEPENRCSLPFAAAVRRSRPRDCPRKLL